MKLLIYSHYFAPSVGGVESIVLSRASGLAQLHDGGGRREFDVIVVTETPAGGYDDTALPFRVIRRPSLRLLWRLIRESDAVYLAGPALSPLFLAWLARRPFIIEHHIYQSVCPNGLLIHQPDRAICSSHFLRREYLECRRCLASEFGGFVAARMLLSMAPRLALSRRAAANIAISRHVLDRCALPRPSVIYYGIEDSFAAAFAASAQRAPGAEGAARSVFCFAYVGRLVLEKGLPIFLEAAHLLVQAGERPFRLRLIGDGPERAKLDDIIRHKHLESCVEITGFLTGEPLAQALQTVDVLVMPSIWEETAGLAAIEQMMRGRLVIVSDVGGLAEVVGDAGIKFPSGDAAALAEAMRRVLADPSLIARYGAQARERALSLFRRERMVAEHARLYRELAAKSHR